MATRRAAAMRGFLVVLTAAGFARFARAAESGPQLTNLDGPVYALATHAGRLVVGGEFTRAGSVAVTHLTAWDGQGWTAFPPLDGPVWALVEFGGDLVVGGAFTTAGGAPAAHVARWDGSAWNALGSGTNADVRCFLVQAGVLLFAGGDFTTAGEFPARGVARWVGNTWTPLGQGLDGSVHALGLHGGQVVAGGDFSTHEGTGFERHVAYFNGQNWLPLATGIDGAVHALANYQGALVIAGDFLQADWVTPAAHIARLVGFGENWSRVGFGFGATDSLAFESVHALHVDGDALFAGGTFASADLQVAANVAQFDGIGWSEIAGGTNKPVLALARSGSSLIAGGDFTLAGGQSAAHVAAFDGMQWMPLIETPIAVADFTASEVGGRVRLTWRLASEAIAEIRSVAVERAARDIGPYETIASLVPEPEMSFVDGDATEPVWYRLALEAADGGRMFAGPVHAGAAIGTRLQLHATMHSSGALAVRYALVRGGDMSLDLFDVRGRLVHRLDAGVRPPGERALVWDRRTTADRRVARGTYWLQLRAGADRVTRRITFVLH